MLYRQRAVIELVRQAERPITKTELMKWSFLLRHEFPSGGGDSFFDFLPYRYGPYSFSLSQEVSKLEGYGYLSETTKSWMPGRVQLDKKIRKEVQFDIEKLLKKYSGWKLEKLVDYVYSEYPSFTCNSTLKKLSSRPKTKPAVFTAGYERESVDSFLNKLIDNGIRQIIDVRSNPVARRYGFHKSTLKNLSSRLDIRYEHFPMLGIVSDKRKGLGESVSEKELFQNYRRTTLKTQTEAVEEVGSLMKKKPSVLVCIEEHHSNCHRSHLAESVSKVTGLPVRHIKAVV